MNKRHLTSNVFSFGIISISGLLVNILIVRFYGAATLGFFNQIMSVYFITSQFSAFGIHLSALTHISLSEEPEKIFSSAVFLVLITSTFFSFLSFVGLTPILSHFGFDEIKKSMGLLSISIIFFSLNKVMIFSLNGFGHLNKFAFSNALRLILMLFFVFISILNSIKTLEVSKIILSSEIILSIFLLFSTKNKFSKINISNFFLLSKAHLSFGRYALFSGLIVDLNTKIDVIFLSFFVGKAEIGVYSFASMLGEGIYQFVCVFKNINARKLSAHIHNPKTTEKFKIEKSVYIFIQSFIFFTFFLFVPFSDIVTGDSYISSNGLWIYLIYCSGIIISTKYLLIDNALLLAKKTKEDNIIRLTSVIINSLLCLFLIPFFGIYGAAISLCSSTIATALLMNFFLKKAGIKV